MTTVTLYARPDCPYSKRIRRIREVLEVDYEEVIVPESKAERTELDALTGQRSVPVLVDECSGGWIADSSDIASHLKDHYK